MLSNILVPWEGEPTEARLPAACSRKRGWYLGYIGFYMCSTKVYVSCNLEPKAHKSLLILPILAG